MKSFHVWDYKSLPREARGLRGAAMLAMAAVMSPVVTDDDAGTTECHAGAASVCAAHSALGLLCRRCADEHMRHHEAKCAACRGAIGGSVLAPPRRAGVAFRPVTIRLERANKTVSSSRLVTVRCELHDSCMQHLYALFAYERARPDPPEGDAA